MCACAYTVERQSYGTLGVRKSEISITLKSSITSRSDAVLYIFHEECAAAITMEHWLILKLKLRVPELKLMTRSHLQRF